MYATLESQGLTGVGFIQIQGGSRDGLALLQNGDSRPPVIPSRASQLEKVFQSAPEIADQLVVLTARLQGFLSDENRDAVQAILGNLATVRSEEHTSELQSLMRISYAVFCLKQKTNKNTKMRTH